MPSSHIEAIELAIHDYEEKYPQFLNSNYQPTPEEAEEHKKYLTLKRDLDRANSLTAFRQFQAKVNDDTPITDQAVELMLALTGLRFVPEPLKFNETRVVGEIAKAQSEPHGNEPPKALETSASAPVVAPKKSADAVMADVVNTAPALPAQPKLKRGPKANMEFHRAVAKVVHSYGPYWKERLEQIVRKLDKSKLQPLAAWAKRNPPSRSWDRAWQHYPGVVLKAIEYSLEMAAKDITEKPSETLGNLR